MRQINYWMKTICFSYLFLLTFFVQGQTTINQDRNLRYTTFELLVLNTSNEEIIDAKVMINQDTFTYVLGIGYRIPKYYLNKKVNLKVFHDDYDLLTLQSVSFPLYPRIFLFKKFEKYFLANGIHCPLTKYGESVLAVHVARENEEYAQEYIKKIISDNDLILGINLEGSIGLSPHGVIENVGENCYLENLFWIQKKDKSNWGLKDSVVISKLRSDSMLDAVGIPIGSPILTNEIIIEFYGHLGEKQIDPILQRLESYTPTRYFNDYFWILSIPNEVLLFDDLIKDLMKIREIRLAYPNSYGFVCDD